MHFLYCSAFGTGLALALAYYYNPSAKNIKAVLTVSLVFFAPALISDFRVTNWQITQALADAGVMNDIKK